jgi:transposase
MWIIGADYHPRFQQVAVVNTDTGEYEGRRLEHTEEAERFYRSLAGQAVRVGMEATGHTRWFERLLAELGHELWIGNPAAIRASAPRKQKTDVRDAELLLRLLMEQRFPRIWVPPAEERDVRQLLLHRHRLVQMRTRVKNQLRAVALSEGMPRSGKPWIGKGLEEFQALQLPAWTARRRQDNLDMLDELVRRTRPLDQAVAEQAERRPEVQRLMTHPGVGPITALAFVLTIGDPTRFPSGKHVASYLGLIPAEHSSGRHQRLGHITKQGNALVRGLLTEAALNAVRSDSAPDWRRSYTRLAMKKHRAIAIIAIARKLAIRLWWMWLRGLDYQQVVLSGSHAG